MLSFFVFDVSSRFFVCFVSVILRDFDNLLVVEGYFIEYDFCYFQLNNF